MSYKAGICTAILALKDRTGSSMIAIKKHMQAALPKSKTWQNATFLSSLKSMVAAGDLVQIKNSYKLSADMKKKLTKGAPAKKAAPAKKKAPAKKTTAKKSTTKKTATKKKTTTKKKAPVKKTAAKKKTAPKKKAPAKKVTKKKAPAKKSASKKK